MEWTKSGEDTPDSPFTWVSDNGWYAIEKHPFGERYILKGITQLRRVHCLGIGTLPETQRDAEEANALAAGFRLTPDAMCPWSKWWED